ncbi:hypothetical protein THERMOS_58 [Bathymodiolus thermophilus thioautotrophic gill symbiont]|uniref:Uncharacterized protein n=1 Tax=Bathymodiolus thermophilus thioautotrophic gill symbiont TaxID=2360 RepID=A0A8H8XAP9_9GAMM|nr:hypothetical protein THERMOS_58 [Bathymodiolus thermophilus thioautotrophic gill symbiont]
MLDIKNLKTNDATHKCTYSRFFLATYRSLDDFLKKLDTSDKK